MSISITSLKNTKPDCGSGLVLPHALAAGVEMAPAASGGVGPASGQYSKGVHLLGVASVLGRRGKSKTVSKGAHGKSNLILKLKAAVGLCSSEQGRRHREFPL